MKANNKILVQAIAEELTFCLTIQHVPVSVQAETRHQKNKGIWLLLNGKEYLV